MSKTTNLVRIWRPLHAGLKKVAPEYSIAIGDFVSTVLFTAIFNDPVLIKYVLMNDYDLNNEEAEEFLDKLRIALLLEMNVKPVSREVYEVPVSEWRE